MNNVPVEQICEVGIVRIDEDAPQKDNVNAVGNEVELVYERIHTRAKTTGKVLAGVTQSINTETGKVGETYYIVYIITLVGTVIDAALVEAQQRMQQFDPRNVIRGRNN
jgi:hypothetical protein